MAKRRMFSTEFLQSDNFSDLPFSCQVLYFNLMASADDDGFISGPRRIMRGCNCAEEDLKYLVKAGFIFVFDSGIAVIRHWLIHNHIRKDRHAETVHAEEKAQLELKNGVYVWREAPEKKQNTCAENARTELKNGVHTQREEAKTKQNKQAEIIKPALEKDLFAWPENAKEQTNEPAGTKERFCFPKEWESIAERPQADHNANNGYQRQDQKSAIVVNQPGENYFKGTE